MSNVFEEARRNRITSSQVEDLVLFIYLFIINLFILFLAALGLRCCVWAFYSCGEWGLLFIVEHRL